MTIQADDRIRFQAQLLDAVEQPVIATDLTGRIIFWNRFAETLYGWSADETLGRQLNDMIPTPHPAAKIAARVAHWQRGDRWSGELLVQRRDGATFSAQMLDSPVLDEQGALIGVVNISHDRASWK